jgi:hypothetical protein
MTFVAVAAAVLVLPSSALASKEYVLKHPKREHCRVHYVRKSKTVHRRIHGHRVKVHETVCVYKPPATPVPLAALAPATSFGATVTSPERSSQVGSADRFSDMALLPTVEKVSPDEGPAHKATQFKSIHIKGTNFTGTTAVHFGSTSATRFTVESSTLIIVTSPGGAPGVVDVTVTTPGGTSPTNPADRFTFLENLVPPLIDQINPNRGPAAGGTSVTILGKALIEATAVEFGGISAASFAVDTSECEPAFSNSCAVITAVAPAETVGGVEVVVTTPSGSSAGRRCGDHPLYPTCMGPPFFQFKNPTITNVSPKTGPVLGGTLVTVTGTGFAVGNTRTSFKFGGAGANIAAECASITTCTVMSPAHGPATVNIVVTVQAVERTGTAKLHNEASPADQFTYM